MQLTRPHKKKLSAQRTAELKLKKKAPAPRARRRGARGQENKKATSQRPGGLHREKEKTRGRRRHREFLYSMPIRKCEICLYF